MQKLLSRITPFIILGIAITAFAFGLILLAYLLLIGATIGIILFAINKIKERFFTPKKTINKPRQGKTIDSDDWRVL